MQAVTITRQQRGEAIARQFGWVRRVDDNSYKVHSQSGNFEYDVVRAEMGSWRCSCPDSMYRGERCKHIVAVSVSFIFRTVVAREPTVIQAVSVKNCPTCNSENIVKHGVRKNKKAGAIQRWFCKECSKWFVINLGFERMRATPQAITGAMQLYFTGESFRGVRDFLKLQGVNVSHVTIYSWIGKYVKLMEGYVEKLKPQVSDTWRTDELYVKVKGNMKYLFAMMDDDTRYRIAQQVAEHKGTSDVRPMFREAMRVAGKKPDTLISDGANNFHQAYKKEYRTVYAESPNHIRDIRFDGTVHNNKMERQNGEWRDREKVMRSLKKDDSPVIGGMQIFHNFIRPHMGLNGSTPAERAGIQVEGENKWLTLIQNATKKGRTES